jgi:integrase/recombinase XerD
MRNKYAWNSGLAGQMQKFLTLKRMSGFKYEPEERLMEKFDQFCYETGFSGQALTREVVDGFCYGIHYEKGRTRYNKEKLLHGFAEYLSSNGFESYICPKKSAPRKKTFEPYIYTEDELNRFFQAIDGYPPHPLSNRQLVDPLMFRMIYGCGLRISEALNLKFEHVDMEEGTITILQSKNNKDRRIPMAASLIKRSRKYREDMHMFSGNDTYYFKSPLGGRLDLSTAYRRFRDYLWSAGIPHSGHGPRIHDLRHVYCVHCLKRWVLAGKDLTNLLPYLSAYLGHSDFRGTQYYLRLTADLYPDMIQKTEAALGYLIPERSSHEENE